MSLVEQVHVEPEGPLSESKPKAQLELSANGTWTLNECEVIIYQRKRERTWEQITTIP